VRDGDDTAGFDITVVGMRPQVRTVLGMQIPVRRPAPDWVVLPALNRMTAGAALNHLDRALWLIRNNSHELATLVAKYLVFDSRLSQSVYAISDHFAHSDPLVERFDRWVRDMAISLDVAADALETNKRALTPVPTYDPHSNRQ
jgi:hypothetical protein